jgi:hypothetical protein
VTALEVVSHPDGREFVVEARARGLRHGGGDGASIALDAVGWLVNRFRTAGWVVEVRPWPTGRAVMTEHLDGQDEAIRRADVLVAEIASGGRSL